ncbi:MAG: hypothetical protein ACK5JM_00660 [Rhodoblastus sp.]
MASSHTRGFEQFQPETLARLQQRYEAGAETIAAIAREEGLTPKKLQAMKHALGWRARRQPSARKKPPAKTTKRAARAKPAKPVARKTTVENDCIDTPALVSRIRAQLEGALAAAQARGPGADPDEIARLMASLTRTLASLRQLEKDTGSHDRRDGGDDAPPLDLAELRRELARRIDRLREEREDS